MNDLSKNELRLMSTLLVGVADGLIAICEENEITVGSIEYQQDGQSAASYSVKELIAVCKYKLGINFDAKALRDGAQA